MMKILSLLTMLLATSCVPVTFSLEYVNDSGVSARLSIPVITAVKPVKAAK